MSDVVIQLDNISKFYKLYDDSRDRLKEALHPFKKKYHKPFYALKGLNLEIKKGDVLGVVGRNGCGKSTLLKLITGVLQPSEGAISVKGKITALLELGAGLNPEFTGIDNIRFYAKILGLTDKVLKEKLPSIIEFAELGDFLYQPVKTYSSGMRARLGFAVAVHVDPEILILDEVLAVGDALFRRKCYAKMEEFFKAGKTIIYVSHDANSINQLCNRAILIHEGRVIMDGRPSEVTKYYEKVLFSSIKGLNKVLGEIESVGAEENQEIKIDAKGQHGQSLEFYIEGLVSKSIVKYDHDLIEIDGLKIETARGDVVNALTSGERYILKYKVKFASSFERIAFALKIKDEKGVQLTGNSTHMSGSLHEIKSGEQYEVSWSFNCNLLAGLYYSNAGVIQMVGNEPVVLARIVDGLVFKVIPRQGVVEGGLVYMNTNCDVYKS